MKPFRQFLVLVLATSIPGAAREWIVPPAATSDGYPVPAPDFVPQVPAAHGAHRDYLIEWWYWVGHLEIVDDNTPLGFQATVFRRAGKADQAGPEDRAPFSNRQIYMAHAALSDLGDGKYYHEERLLREGWQAQAKVGELGLRVGPIVAHEADGRFKLQMRLRDEVQLALTLTPEKPMVVFGDRGLSRKGSDPAAVSWYWTYTRLRAEGTLKRNGRTQKLRGLVWMDHEISSNQLGGDLAGWDWTCMHLDDGSEVKAYRLRKEDGSPDRWSAVYWIDPEGKTRKVYADDFTWKEDDHWTSPETGNRYPVSVTVRATDPRDGTEKTYRLEPFLKNQEMGGDSGNAYWEGACKVTDAKGRSLGKAYLELAGYGDGLASQLGNDR